jgi:AAA domain (dynein-related subfamily)
MGVELMTEHIMTLEKESLRSLNAKVVHDNVDRMISGLNNRNLTGAGWKIEYVEDSWVSTNGGDVKLNTLEIRITFESKEGVYARKEDPAVLNTILRNAYVKASQNNNGRWTLTQVDGEPYVNTSTRDDDVLPDLALGYADFVLPPDYEERFSHLFGLDNHIGIIRSAIEAGMESDWRNRFNCALIGPPGCGKSDICQTLKRMMGDEAVMEFDATATTAAGAIKEIEGREILPRVLVIEEIEKAPESALNFLLAICDIRSEIRKTTARDKIVKETKLFAVATVNNIDLFEKIASGALASRFAHHIFFDRPNRDMLGKILLREVGKLPSGNLEWIDPSLDYCDKHQITDPRKVISLCLSGRDKWLSGEYIAMLEGTSRSQAFTEWAWNR